MMINLTREQMDFLEKKMTKTLDDFYWKNNVSVDEKEHAETILRKVREGKARKWQ